LIPGLDTISENQKLFARRAGLPQLHAKVVLAREANRFAEKAKIAARTRRPATSAIALAQ
jgi:hypothetical protein